MKKALLALSILGVTCLSANAQTKTTTTTTTVSTETAKAVDTPNYAKNYKVCKGSSTYYVCGDKPSGKKRTAASKTTKARTATAAVTTTPAVPSAQGPNAKNFKVCKGNGNYHICDEPQNATNTVPGPTTKLAVGTADKKPIKKTTTVTENGVVATTTTQTFAQPPATPKSQSIADQSDNTLPVATVTGHVDTINNANAPYHGKNSPQYDGAQKNKARNLNTPPGSPNSIPISQK